MGVAVRMVTLGSSIQSCASRTMPSIALARGIIKGKQFITAKPNNCLRDAATCLCERFCALSHSTGAFTSFMISSEYYIVLAL